MLLDRKIGQVGRRRLYRIFFGVCPNYVYAGCRSDLLNYTWAEATCDLVRDVPARTGDTYAIYPFSFTCLWRFDVGKHLRWHVY